MYLRKPHISQFWTLQLVGWGVYGVISFTGALPYMGTVPHVDSVGSLLANRLAFTIVGLASTAFLRTLHRQREGRSIVHMGLLVALSSYACGMAASMVGNLARYAAGGLYMGGWTLFGGAVSGSAVFLAWNCCYLAICARSDMEREKRNALVARAQAQEAQLAALRGQLNPHFLFNSLNSIQALIGENSNRAQFAVEKLANLLRYSLRQGSSQEGTVGDELEGITQYLAIEKIRFEEKLIITSHVDPAAAKYPLPGFLLQPLVENAVKHGMHTSDMPLRIALRAEVNDESLRLEVANTGKWREQEQIADGGQLHGIGLRLVRERLNIAYPGLHRFAQICEGGWVMQRIEIENIRGRTIDAVSRVAGR
jgi:two-component system, LytTR family, sensor kinase